MKKGISSLIVLVSLSFLGTASSYAGMTERVSVDSYGNQANYDSYSPSISADGRYVAFGSWANNLVQGDTNGLPDIFVHDRVTGITERVNVDSSGNQANDTTWHASVSGDGRYVAFASSANNLVTGDTNGRRDIFVHDRQTGLTERVSIDSSGNQANGDSEFLSISGDGRFVAFQSWATNLVPDVTYRIEWNIFVYDRQTGLIECVSVDSNGNQGNGSSFGPSISDDGRYVVFGSNADNLVPGDTNNIYDAFVYDRQTGLTERVSIDNNGVEGNSFSYGTSISVDGRYVAFQSWANNLAPEDTNGFADIFVRDRVTGVTAIVSVDSNGNQGVYESYSPSISGDGRFVSFYSTSDNLVPGDTNGRGDIFVHDRVTGITERVNVNSNGDQVFGVSNTSTSISVDGRFVSFDSYASNLVPEDTNNKSDVFVRIRDIDDVVDIEGIIDLIDTLDIKNQGMLNSFLSKAENALKMYEQGKDMVAINMLTALINDVEAQKNKGIESSDADKLISYIRNVIDQVIAG